MRALTAEAMGGTALKHRVLARLHGVSGAASPRACPALLSFALLFTRNFHSSLQALHT